MIQLRIVAATVTLATALVVVPLARGDGDPASDVLLVQKVFFPYAAGISASDKAALTSVVTQANAKGFPVRVAVIAGAYDLGSVIVLWRKPRTYAKFLGGEIRFVYKKGLLVTVMPQGFGLFRGTGAQQQALNRIRIGQGADGLVRAATKGVERLAAGRGIKVVPQVPKRGSGSSWRRIAIAVGGAAILAILGLLTYLYLRRPSERSRPAAD